jgi:hypothetical protein
MIKTRLVLDRLYKNSMKIKLQKIIGNLTVASSRSWVSLLFYLNIMKHSIAAIVTVSNLILPILL